MSTYVPIHDPHSVKSVACIGTGTIGGGWAAYFLSRGLDVRAFDPAPQQRARLRANIEAVWPRLSQLDLAPNASLDRLLIYDTIEEALDGVSYVQESIIEDKPAKMALFAELDVKTAANVVLATSSSQFVPSDLAADCQFPQRVIVAHPFVPTYLIPLVELLAIPGKSDRAVQWAREFFIAIGKRPVVLKKEIEGYIGNRLQSGYLDEARRLVEEGYCAFQDIDDVIVNSFGIRLAFMGVSQYYNLGGGLGGIEHMFELFGWKGSVEAQDDLRATVQKFAPGASMEELEEWRDQNIIRILKARRMGPSA
ncbi:MULTISPECIES: 3-hydroxyacyl-CoA dehydrogenase NAD-binding domain-containing protein [Bradyrhizobium]|uniref:3-hydroxyacyl-CoA dehydrogenase NAD-binding domain-containing protein n=1 Tax=Bradyrhizobium centrosematis TaxID=1300039 RepID=UPI00216A38E6|nr:3-hydroxyacyl-CoA dehydrogenase NAD-binding domain-containing protein [Bradyrhizobium centrosematis]MCS3765635.1 carnitine 3-dehydrogenase [Bradyrhizobium centrosematis]MCS3778169.1 carnitine 3-dehydrogenase [Bradyrhizobium centrosematis]